MTAAVPDPVDPTTDHGSGAPTEQPAKCPWCKSTDPNKVGVQQSTGKVCRDPFHCPDPSGHSANGGPFRYCQYCDWREKPTSEPPAGYAVNWAEGGLADTIELDIYTMAHRFGIALTERQVEQIVAIIEERPNAD